MINTSLFSKTCCTPEKGASPDKPFHFPPLYVSDNNRISNSKLTDEGCVPGGEGNASASLAGRVGRLL